VPSRPSGNGRLHHPAPLEVIDLSRHVLHGGRGEVRELGEVGHGGGLVLSVSLKFISRISC
jgi:hypothetical protein